MATKPLQAASPENTQQMFESALSIVRHDTKNDPSRSLPIATTYNAEQIEKRALTDAARALARLWKLSPNLVR